MAGGLLALLDDVAAIAKVAAASLDDVVAQSLKASSKAAGAVIDDTAVTPAYIQGFSADREIPIVWKIAKGSIFNKLVILLPAAMLLSAFAPWAIAPLLMIGGLYLCFEGTEKVWHRLHPETDTTTDGPGTRAASLEEATVRGAIKTDFILSAEIMTIILATLPRELSQPMIAVALALAGVMVTTAVYGAVAMIVKADDLGLRMATRGRRAMTRNLGERIIRAVPPFMTALIAIGTAAMIWVGGSIIVHGLHELGIYGPQAFVETIATGVAGVMPGALRGIAHWTIKALVDGVFGLVAGIVVVLAVTLLRGKADG